MDEKTLSGSAAAFFSAVTWVQPRLIGHQPPVQHLRSHACKNADYEYGYVDDTNRNEKTKQEAQLLSSSKNWFS